jgi:heterodisulfide reductase subunit A
MMLNITINKRKLKAKEGATVLEVAQEAGINIPTLCYHKALTPYGACRLCLVEIVGGARLSIVTSCVYPAQEGLMIETDTERVKKTRKIILELLLARSPDSQKLKELAKENGVIQTRIRKTKTDDCILCGLCIRMCRERMGQSVIGFINRGNERIVGPPFDKTSPICMGCGACAFICPTAAIKSEELCQKDIKPLASEFNWGVGPRPVVNIMYPQAVPNIPVIDKEHCVYFNKSRPFCDGEKSGGEKGRDKEKCRICEAVCGPEAIDYEQKEEIKEIKIGAVLIGTGYDRFNPRLKPEYNYMHSKNIITSPEFERILSASGPFQGHLIRPSDHKEPNRIAFLQCVGSRDETCNPYCSSVCCMYATKEAIVAKEHAGGDLETDIYFMDLRAHGKGFDRYYERAKSEYNVNYRRCRLPRVEEIQDGSRDLVVKYISEEGKLKEERYDLVVLSTGLVSPEDINDLSCKLGIDLNEFNFAQTKGFFRESTSREGIYVCGAVVEPKDIPETVIQASAAASSASSLLAEARGSLVKEKVYPQELDVSEEEPRIGVFVCHCGINIAGTVDVEEVAEYTKRLPNVEYVEHNLYTCSQDTQQKIKEVIKEHKLNRIVIASCTPRTHEPLFQDTIREAGLNPFLLEFVSIREHCSWVHMFEKEKATEKSKELVQMAVAKARLLESLRRSSFSVNKKGLVIGAGISGMSAALSLAEQGFEAYLIEKDNELGGNLKNLYFTLGGDDPQKLLRDTIKRVENNQNIHVYRGVKIKEFTGYIGNYKTKIAKSKEQRAKSIEHRAKGEEHRAKSTEVEIEHGIVIVATGAKERESNEYLRGENERVVTQKELEKKIHQKEGEHEIKKIKCVVMIQCVGSREDYAQYCSRVCCVNAVKNALKLKELNPKLDIYILYRDIRTYGFRELFYEQARDRGIMFIRYEKETKPKVKEIPGRDSQLLIEADDPILGQRVKLKPDLLVLSTGIAPYEENKELGQILKIPLNEDGFFLEAHIKLRPVDFSTDGIYLCGIAHSPKTVDEAISQGRAAAGRAVTLLSKSEISATGRTVKVNERLCSGCGLCVTICPYQARELDKLTGKAKITEVLCQGCGACVVACPSGASQQFGFTKKELLEAVDAFSTK